MWRPLSFLTFALNYHMGGNDVFGYHVVNFIIHYCASLFLFLLIYNTLHLPILKGPYEKTSYAVALLSVFFWATHPIHITSVTYIVQRMASMAGMFYIMAMYFYLKGRASLNCISSVGFFVMCGVAFLLSFASKENAVTLPISLFLYELVLIRGVTTENVKKALKIGVLSILAVLLICLLYREPVSVLDDYKYRPFTLVERLFTEPRVMIFYLTQLFYPISSRLSLLHDIEISGSLFTPWTTFPAVLALVLLIGMGVLISRKRPLIAFAILFFFLNHLIEGSIIPLEPVFEHRNYLPSAFLFVLIGLLATHAINYFSYKKTIYISMCAATAFLLWSQGHTTLLRNKVMRTEITLWQDVVKKAPDLVRPRINLSNALFRYGLHCEALVELENAMNCKPGLNRKIDALPAHNLAQYYLSMGQVDKAEALFRKALGFCPLLPRAVDGMAKVMFLKGMLGEAEKKVRKAISLEPEYAPYHRTLSVILLRKGLTDAAIKAAFKARTLNEDFDEPLYILGEGYRIKKHWRKAALYFERFLDKRPGSIEARIALIEIYSSIGDKALERHQVFSLMKEKGSTSLIDILADYDAQVNFLDSSRIETVLISVKECLAEDLQGLRMEEAIEKLVPRPHINGRRLLLRTPSPHPHRHCPHGPNQGPQTDHAD
ncbi:MAG: hypothetical protein SV775_09390 [Thermodesulfobacteriota bacterium]|nr:hypothetical protein [Thermodesulfobacteriota bacterium]